MKHDESVTFVGVLFLGLCFIILAGGFVSWLTTSSMGNCFDMCEGKVERYTEDFGCICSAGQRD